VYVKLWVRWLCDRSATLEVLAEDDHLHSSPVLARVHVNVLDVNDNAPVIELMPSTSVTSQRDDVTWWQLNVTEHASNGMFVGHVTVSDADDGGSQRVTCSLHHVDNHRTVRLLPCRERHTRARTVSATTKTRVPIGRSCLSFYYGFRSSTPECCYSVYRHNNLAIDMYIRHAQHSYYIIVFWWQLDVNWNWISTDFERLWHGNCMSYKNTQSHWLFHQSKARTWM